MFCGNGTWRGYWLKNLSFSSSDLEVFMATRLGHVSIDPPSLSSEIVFLCTSSWLSLYLLVLL